MSISMASFSLNFRICLFFTVMCHIGKATVYMDDNCGQRITLAGDRLKSQQAATYKSNMDCRITLQAPNTDSSSTMTIVLDFESMNLESATSTSCYDFLEVYDGPSTNSQDLVLRACGSSIPSNIYSTGDTLTLRLKTDGTYRFSGFSLIFTAYYSGSCIDDDEEFYCSSGRCIDSSLECDCKDNCGDDSDEFSCSTCKPDEIYGADVGLSAGAIIGIVVAVLIVVVVVIIIICVVCNKKQKTTRAVGSSHTMTSSRTGGHPPPPQPQMLHMYPPPAPGPPPYAPPPYAPPGYSVSMGTAPGYYPPPPQQQPFPPQQQQQPPFPPQQQSQPPPEMPAPGTIYSDQGNSPGNLPEQPALPDPAYPPQGAPPTGNTGHGPPAHAQGATNHGFQDDPAYPPRTS